MADRYLLESGAPDGYLLEDSSGVLLLEDQLPLVDRALNFSATASRDKRNLQQFVYPNLVTSLLVSTGDTTTKLRQPIYVRVERRTNLTVNIVPNLLTSTLGQAAPVQSPFANNNIFINVEAKRNINSHVTVNLLNTLYEYPYVAVSYPESLPILRRIDRTIPYQYPNLNVTTLASSAIIGTANITEGADTSSASGTTTVVGTLSVTVANDTVSASGTTTIVGTLTFTNADDTVSASGTVGSAVDGTANITEGADTSSASGTTTIVGTLSITNSDDTSNASGTTTIIGSLSITNNNDTASAFGVVGTPTPGSSYLPLTGVGR